MIFTKEKDVPKPKLTLAGKEIEWVAHYKYLGVKLDENLNWTQHINNIVKKANVTMLQCKTMIRRNYGLSPKVCKWIYQGMILSVLTYGSTVWIYATRNKKLMKKLEKVQRNCMMAATNSTNSTPTAGLQVIRNIRAIDIQIQETALYAYTRMVKMEHGKFNKEKS